MRLVYIQVLWSISVDPIVPAYPENKGWVHRGASWMQGLAISSNPYLNNSLASSCFPLPSCHCVPGSHPAYDRQGQISSIDGHACSFVFYYKKTTFLQCMTFVTVQSLCSYNTITIHFANQLAHLLCLSTSFLKRTAKCLSEKIKIN